MQNTNINRYSFLLIFTLLIFLFTGAMCSKDDDLNQNKTVEQEIVVNELYDMNVNDDSDEEKKYTYENSTYGFTLQIPEKYNFTEDIEVTKNFATFKRLNTDPTAKPDGNSEMKPDSAKVLLSMFTKPEETFAEDYIEEEIIGSEVDIKTKKIGTTGDMITYRYQYVNDIGPAIDYIIEYPNGDILQIVGYYGKGDIQPKIMEQIYKIQDSFRPN